MCRQSVEQKKRKAMPFVIPDMRKEGLSPIVKDYQRVPTSTKEFLDTGTTSSSNSSLPNTHIEMYRGEEEGVTPLIK
jgi:hypothetical protein